MKKSKLALTAASVLLAAGVLASCGEEPEEKATVSKVTYSGINSSFKSTDTIDWSKFQVTVKYSDESAITFTSDKMEFDTETPVSTETELLVKTEGLHAMEGGSLAEKRYYVSVALKEDFTKYYDAGSIAVGDIIRDKYDLIEYSNPRFVNTLNTIASHAGEANEGSFKKFNNDFTVGTLNPWKFEPVATFSEKGHSEEMDDFTTYEKDVKLFVLDGASETEVSPEAYARILLADGTYQFSSEDAGKRFKIVMAPKDFEKDFVGDDVKPVSFEFNVQEGINVYNAKQLGVLNLTNLKSEEFIGDKAYVNHYRKAQEGIPASSNEQGDIFLLDPLHSTYGNIDAPRVWEKFLVDNGEFTEETIEKFRDVKGVFLQNDIAIQTTDIPTEFFISEYDPVNYTLGGINTGALRDDASIYSPTTLNELTISGNYFKLDSSAIPLCKNTTDSTVCGNMGGYPIASFTEDWSYQIPPGHANLFEICGVYPSKTDEFYTNQVYSETTKRCTIKNILTIGNTGKDISSATDLDKKMKVTGLIFAKSSYAPTTMENLIIQEYMIGLFADHGLGQAVGQIPQTDHTFIKDSKVFDCSNSGIFNYRDGGTAVSNTVMKRFGGACLINAGRSGNNSYLFQPNTSFTSDCEFENYVTGGEVYFSAVQATESITAIQGFDAFFAYSQKALVGPEGSEHAGKMNVIALQMDGDGYTSAKNGKYSGTITTDKGEGNELKVELNENTTSKPMAATCKTNVASDGSYTLDQDDAMMSAGWCAGITGNRLNMDLCIGASYLSIIFDLFTKAA